MINKFLFFLTLLTAVVAVIFLYQKAVNFDKIYPQPLNNTAKEEIKN